jgi:glycosyltransferase involved in cell wall biosynthesis
VYFYVQPDSPLFEKAKGEELPAVPLRTRGDADLRAVLRLAAAMKRRRCRLAHFHDAHSLAVGSAAAALARVPIRILSRRVDFPIRNNALSKKKYTRNIDRIIAISEGVRRVLLESGIDSKLITVVPSGIDFTPFEEAVESDHLHRELGFERDDFLVGIVAHLADHKGHTYLIRATQALKRRAPRIKVVIVGDGPLRWDLDRQAREDGVADMVFFLGFREDVPRILGSLDLFVLSSKLEGMGTSIMDAMASRLPVVATRVGGIPEVVADGRTGLLVPPEDPEALAAAILRLYQDRALARRLGEAGYQVVHEKFSAQSMAGRIIREYERIADRKVIALKG